MMQEGEVKQVKDQSVENQQNTKEENSNPEDEEDFPQNLLDDLRDFQEDSDSIPNDEENKEENDDQLIDVHWQESNPQNALPQSQNLTNSKEDKL